MNYKKFSSFKSLVSVSLLSLILGTLTAACGSSSTTSQISDTQTSDTQPASPTVEVVEASDINTEDYRADASIESEVDSTGTDIEKNTSEIDFSDACIRNDCDVSVSPRPLSIEEVNTISEEISPDRTLIHEQSFSITLPVIGQVEFVAEESQDDHLHLSLRTASNEYEALYESRQWKLLEVTAVAFEDIHRDGDGPDIIVIADYITGIGPTGAQPFSAPIVLFNRGDDSFQNDYAVDQILSSHNVSTISGVVETAQIEGLVRGLQYREGP